MERPNLERAGQPPFRDSQGMQAAENLRRWYAAMEAADAMLIAGLRDRVGPEGNLREAYHQWQESHRAGKLRAYERAAERFAKFQANGSAPSELSDAT